MHDNERPTVFIRSPHGTTYAFKLKGSGELVFHLGCGINCDSIGTLCMDPGKYIDRMEEVYVQNFKTKPVQRHRLSLQEGDHPELDIFILE